MAMKDTYPTLMSILGIEPEPWMEGVAKAGMYEDVDFEYDALFSMVARESTIQGWKSFAAYNKEFYYQYHTLTMEAIEAREATGLSTAAEIAEDEINEEDERFVYTNDLLCTFVNSGEDNQE